MHLADLTANRAFAVGLGAAHLLLGAVGFVVSFGTPPLDPAGVLVIAYFTANPLHSVVSMAIGGVLIVAGLRSLAAARRVNAIMGTFLLVFGVAGLYLIGTPANVLALTPSDVLVLFASAALLLPASLGADRAAGGAVESGSGAAPAA
ncbi:MULTISPECIES: DUF4383 domain-containing protein [unclassified Microcella]|uniref:DUF4383 domain-containing protein n=1 Tax=unclassified Microcella TaxID=2630066 RepID=UPI0006F63BA8|nr:MULTISPECIES: DUF4383 domain-containing protein [unclassified Microcella]KQV25875.1 hypothetical protein ASC54_02570 [Yonghaparkia sp. Root332]KRF33316.1 hypothetical protein ASG83_05060 [Yonghaparkia sp. Soil809]